MAYRNQNYMTNRLIKETVDKNQVGYVDPEAEEETFTSETYYFKSYSDDQGTTLWGSGTVRTIEESGDYTKVKVLTNDTESSFVNQEFYITSNANADGTTLYPLYSDAGTTAIGIYVKVSKTVFPEENEETFTPELYYFKSYSDAEGTNQWDSGTVETTETESNGYTKVRVITNEIHEEFVNQEFYITSDANADGTTLYPLYSDAGTTEVGIYVKVSETEF